MLNKRETISRRCFEKSAVLGAAVIAASFRSSRASEEKSGQGLRLGGRVFEKYKGPGEWVQAVKKLGYNAAYCPVKADASDDVVRAYEKAAGRANIVIAEVGVWKNTLNPDKAARKEALEKCYAQLDLADRIGAKCCVNVSGSRGEKGAHKDNLTEETFDMIVETTRHVIDTVKPTRTYFSLETLPYAYPDSVHSYVRLIEAIDRKRFAVHLDPVNLINSHSRFYGNTEVILDFFKLLGPRIKSCHAKDVRLESGFPVNITELQAGLGELDYKTYLRELYKLPETPPLMIEHLKTAEEYEHAAEYIRSVAKREAIPFA